jgi:hypothetical protein
MMSRTPTWPEGIEFSRRFPNLTILDPPTFLEEIRKTFFALSDYLR